MCVTQMKAGAAVMGQTSPVGVNSMQGWRPAAMARTRRKAGLTQVELAERLGVHQSMVARFESGARSPRVTMAFQIASALGVDPSELMELPRGLARLRVMAGMTQAQAADLLGFPRTTLQRLEAASSLLHLSDDHVAALATAYDVSEDEIRSVYAELR